VSANDAGTAIRLRFTLPPRIDARSLWIDTIEVWIESLQPRIEPQRVRIDSFQTRSGPCKL